MATQQRNYAPIIVLGLLAVTTVAVIYFATRKTTTATRTRRAVLAEAPKQMGIFKVVPMSDLAPAREVLRSQAVPKEEVAESTDDLPKTFYLNKEKWHIDWNAEGFPTDITVERNAKRS